MAHRVGKTCTTFGHLIATFKKVSEYDQVMTQPHTAYQPTAPLERATEHLLVGFVALRPKSTAMVIAGRSVHLITLFPGQA